jgi:alginate O-acetyltransferase complex protein AlgI
MVFSDPTFLFCFLPLVIAAYFLTPNKLKDTLLLIASLVFYTWGEDEYVAVILSMIAFNYGWGLLLSKNNHPRMRFLLLTLGVALNLLTLVFFKYAYFLATNFAAAPNLIEYTQAIHLPIGISFFTFQALTYLVDLYRNEITVQRNPLKLALYISLFPQLIAGPIVRYSEVERDLINRITTRSDFIEGTHRFIIGLAKKALIADPLGLVADQVFGIPNDGLSSQVAWFGIICYSFQIFFDFSAYSDMAIGLGKILGFKFPENFNYPYCAKSVTEFWQRWHMTLSRWFRDYVYIPLGGNRKGNLRTYLNLFLVFVLCGFWHGSSWNFMLWGAYYGVFLIIERMGLSKLLAQLPQVFQRLYLLLVVVIGWVPFRAETSAQTEAFLKNLFTPNAGINAVFYPLERYANSYIWFTLCLAVIFAMPTARYIGQALGRKGAFTPIQFNIQSCGNNISMLMLLLICVVVLGAASYSPFIYFRF